jgi:hypothetical protein
MPEYRLMRATRLSGFFMWDPSATVSRQLRLRLRQRPTSSSAIGARRSGTSRFARRRLPLVLRHAAATLSGAPAVQRRRRAAVQPGRELQVF